MTSAIDPATIVSADATNDEIKTAFTTAKSEISALQGATVVAQTTDVTLAAADNGKTFTNEGASAKVLFTLPTAAAGYRFKFAVLDTDGLRVTAAAGDTIRNAAAVSAAAGYVENTAIGSYVEIESLNATDWLVTQAIGTWTPT